MIVFMGRMLRATVVGLAGLAAFISPAAAQWNPPPMMSGAGGGLPAQAGFSSQPPAAAVSYVPYSPYVGQYYNPQNGNLYGAAQVINASSGYMTAVQQANLGKEQVKRAKLDNKRAAFDEWRYEQKNTPTLEEEREQFRQQQLRRSLKDPPVTEIWSGKALNDLLLQAQTLEAARVQGPNVYLSPAVLNQINVTDGTTSAGIGVLKNGGQLDWPFTLQAPEYASLRKRTDELAAAAVKQAASGRVAFDTIQGLMTTQKKLQAALKANIVQLSPNDYIQAKRFLNDLDEATKVLKSPNVANLVTGKWSAQGQTVAELVQNMTSQGLRFAPAVVGQEAAYTTLHRALANYESSMAQYVAQAPASQQTRTRGR
jgi:hypothetical protein